MKLSTPLSIFCLAKLYAGETFRLFDDNFELIDWSDVDTEDFLADAVEQFLEGSGIDEEFVVETTTQVVSEETSTMRYVRPVDPPERPPFRIQAFSLSETDQESIPEDETTTTRPELPVHPVMRNVRLMQPPSGPPLSIQRFSMSENEKEAIPDDDYTVTVNPQPFAAEEEIEDYVDEDDEIEVETNSDDHAPPREFNADYGSSRSVIDDLYNDGLYDDSEVIGSKEEASENETERTPEQLVNDFIDGQNQRLVLDNNDAATINLAKLVDLGFLEKSRTTNTNNKSQLFVTKKYCETNKDFNDHTSLIWKQCHFHEIVLTSYYCLAENPAFYEIWQVCREYFDYDWCHERYVETVETWRENDSIYDPKFCEENN